MRIFAAFLLAPLLCILSLPGDRGLGEDADSPPEAAPVASEPPKREPAASEEIPSSLAELKARLRDRFPDRESVTEHADEITAELLEFAAAEDIRAQEAGASEGAEAPLSEAGSARLFAAEILVQGGKDREGLALLQEVERSGPTDDDRAKALFLLGQRYFFRGAYLSTGSGGRRSRGSALESWGALAERYPESPWARRVERPLRYLRLLDGGAVPDFEATFRAGEEDVKVSRQSLLGKVAVIDFWRSTTPGQAAVEKTLARDIPKVLDEYPGLRGKVVVLGVNLDDDRQTFEETAEDWGIPWPQLHDGKGFETPLAVLFGIPMEPHFVILDAQGSLAFLGAESGSFYAALSRELKRVRGVENDAEQPETPKHPEPPAEE